MKRKKVWQIMLKLLFVAMLTLAFNVQQAGSSEPRTAEWNKTYGGYYYDWAYSVVETGDGGYALAGDTVSFGAGLRDFWLVKVDSSGNMEWNKTYGGANDDRARSIIETGDGGYALAGYTNSFGAGSTDFWLVKVDSSGNMEWNKTYGGAGSDFAWSVAETSDEGYALAGYTNSFGAGLQDFWLVKVGRARHDVAITNVTSSKTVVGQGYDTLVNVTVRNQGYYTENFNVTVYADQNVTSIGHENTIGKRNVTVASGDSITLPFTWDTTGFAKGNYTISANATGVTNETITADNSYTDGTVRVNMPGDVAPEFGVVNIIDIVYVAIHFGAEKGKPPPPNTQPYEANADINSDAIINIIDIVAIAVHFGETDC